MAEKKNGPVYALVLAGGRSKRMGRDKALLDLAGEPLLHRAVRFWQSIPGLDGVLVSVGEADHFAALPEGAASIPDLYPGCGPLAGLHAAFSLTDAEIIYVSAVDMPFLRAEALPPLDLEKCNEEQVRMCFAAHGDPHWTVQFD